MHCCFLWKCDHTKVTAETLTVSPNGFLRMFVSSLETDSSFSPGPVYGSPLPIDSKRQTWPGAAEGRAGAGQVSRTRGRGLRASQCGVSALCCAAAGTHAAGAGFTQRDPRGGQYIRTVNTSCPERQAPLKTFTPRGFRFPSDTVLPGLRRGSTPSGARVHPIGVGVHGAAGWR